jgi:hypothetical protein
MDVMKKLAFYLLIFLLALHATGCTSMYVFEKARGTPPRYEDAEPAYYALLPLTIPLDVTLAGAFLYLETQGYHADYGCPPSSVRDGGLRVRRP